MFAEGYVCLYCLAIHGFNLSFATGAELLHRTSGGQRQVARQSWAALAIFSASCAFVTLTLVYFERHSTESAQDLAEQHLQQALDEADAAARTGSTDQTNNASADIDSPARVSFQPGRYGLGPETAPVHIVVISDYQCPSCRKFDTIRRELVAQRGDVSLSARHFPFCSDCNELIEKTRHPNACRAAVAAEAAGIAGGTDAFWQMHDWLFDRGGSFTDEGLLQFVAEIGVPQEAFREALASEKTIEIIRSDALTTDAAGLKFTPMVFINGTPMDVGK